MSVALRSDQKISVEEYLAGELQSQVRHEYLGGDLYAMAGASREHNIISLNIASALREHLRGGPCRVFIADMKVRLKDAQGDDYFYYPDVMVSCDPADNARYFMERPSVLIEVLSPESWRVDEREKYHAYPTIPSLQAYVIVDQAKVDVRVYRRGEPDWTGQRLTSKDTVLWLETLDFSMPLARVYEDVAV
jgi:Uma2 family endonuclease